MVQARRHFVDPGVQRAAQRHVQLLHAAADRQHGHALRHHLVDQR
jgi:hypothetical protein